MNKTQKKVVEDINDLKDSEIDRMRRDKLILRKVSSYVKLIEYWLIVYCLPVSLLIWLLTGDYWKGLGFFFFAILWTISANIRGLFLHIEGLIEFFIKKQI